MPLSQKDRDQIDQICKLMQIAKTSEKAHGEEPCPSGCGGKVQWHRDISRGGRGHTRGVCSTVGCLRWLE